MSENYCIRHARPEDFEGLIKMLDSVFGFPSERTEGFLSLLPKLYEKDKPNNIVAERDGELLGAVGLFRREIKVGDETLVSMGIGNVACRADMRGEGIMTSLMERAVEEIVASGADLSDLGGRRHRYGHFGYECAGRVYNFRVRDDFARHVPEADVSRGVTALPIEEYKDEAKALFEAKRHRFFRDDFLVTLASWEADSYAFTENGSFAGYAVCDGDRVTEMALCDTGSFASAVKALFAVIGEDELTFALHETETELIKAIAPIYDGISLRSNEQIAVMHHRRVAEAYLRYKNELAPLPDGEIGLLIHGIKGDELFTLVVADGEVTSRDGADDPIELSAVEAVAFFYGLASPHRELLPRAAASWLPLPVYFPSPDCV